MSFAEYAAHGWKLCAIEPGQKGPLYVGWNKPEKLDEITSAAAGLDGAGLAHAASGTCALDLDDLETARPWLAERGVDVDALMAAPDAVMISSGRANRGKLLYKMARPLRTLKPKESGLELRCATAAGLSVQDALPPTIHPITKKPYEWRYGDALVGHWSALPPIPAQLLALWRNEITDTTDGTVAPSHEDVSIDTVRKTIFRYITTEKKDVSNYDDWLEIGARLHEQLGGAEEGIDIWDEWSRTDKSLSPNGQPRYQGRDTVRLHYISFGKAGGRRVGMSHLISQEPASAEEFDIEQPPDVAEEDSTQAKMAKAQAAKKADAQAALEKRLVYVDFSERYFDTKTRRIINTESAIEHKFTHMMARKKGGKRESPVQVLKESSTKRTVDKVGFHPGEGAIFRDREDYSYANTYNGSRIPEPLEPTSEELERIEWLFDRIDDPVYRRWLKQFYAHAVQRPGVKIRSAPLIWSETQGNGKTTLTRMIPSLLVGAQYSQEVTTTQLEDSFTGFLADKWHLYLGEFRVNSRAEREAIAKKVEKWIADDVITVRPMHQIAYDIPNHLIVTASSNYDDAASISTQDRKWAIHHLLAAQMTEEEQAWIYDEFLLTPRAAGVLRHYFLHLDLTGFSPNAKALQTDDRGEMVAASANSDSEAMELAFEEHTGPFARDVVLISDVSEFLRKSGSFRPSLHRIGRLLAKAPFNGHALRFRVGESRYRGVVIRNHRIWSQAPGKDIMAHIQGTTLADDADFDDESVDLLA